MSVAHDIFAETNPGFCACALVSFVGSFVTVNEMGPEIPVAYLALPIALSEDLKDSFEGTNKNTGLLEWLERSPQVHLGLKERVDGTMSIVAEAIRFSCFSHVLTVTDVARLNLGQRVLKKNLFKKTHEGITEMFKRAERLGYWFASAGSTKSIFDAMDLTV